MIFECSSRAADAWRSGALECGLAGRTKKENSWSNLSHFSCLVLLTLSSVARSLVRSTITSQAEVFDRGNPWYRLGDYNGNGLQDLAVLVLVESGREELRKHGVQFINPSLR